MPLRHCVSPLAPQSLHLPSDDDAAASAASNVLSRERDRPAVESLPLLTTLDEDETLRSRPARRMDEVRFFFSPPALRTLVVHAPRTMRI